MVVGSFAKLSLPGMNQQPLSPFVLLREPSWTILFGFRDSDFGFFHGVVHWMPGN
jgi:hypothetical protein